MLYDCRDLVGFIAAPTNYSLYNAYSFSEKGVTSYMSESRDKFMNRYPKRDRQLETPDQISRDSTKERIEMFFCLMPIFGLIPSAIALIRQRSSRNVRDVSQVAITLMIAWAIAYGAMGGLPTEGETLQVTTELIKASFSSGYFAICMYLMYRLYRHQAIALPWLKDISANKATRSAKRDQKRDN